MDLQNLSAIANIIQTVAFILSVTFVWVQIRESNRLSRIANNRTSFQLSSPLLMQFIKDREMTELRIRGSRDYEALDEVDKFRYVQFLFWWLILHDDIYYQYQNGLMDDDTYQGWDHELKEFIRENHLGVHWEREMKPFFRADFQKVIEQKLQQVSA